MREQQELLLLWLHLGEYGKKSSHAFHEILKEKEGTFMVQGCYPSTLEDHERLPCRKNIFSHSSMVVDDLGIWDVKEISHGALSQRPTTLSHRSMFLWMEYSEEKMYSFFLQIFMRRFLWEDLLMDLTFIQLTMYGRECIFVLVDYSIEYLYLLTIYEQCITPQESKSIFGFHGHFTENVCTDSSPSIHDFG